MMGVTLSVAIKNIPEVGGTYHVIERDRRLIPEVRVKCSVLRMGLVKQKFDGHMK
jgi:hypothetical protein